MNNQRWSISAFALAVLGMSPFSGASAQSRCDCSEIVDSCRAQITEVPIKSPGSRFLIKSDSDHCAIVEYTIDGMQGQTTVWDDGDEIDNVSPRKPGGKLAIRSCRMCKDRLKDGKDKATAPSSGGAGSCRQYEFVQHAPGGVNTPVTEEKVRSAVASGVNLDEEIEKGEQKRADWGLTQDEERTMALMTCVKENP